MFGYSINSCLFDEKPLIMSKSGVTLVGTMHPILYYESCKHKKLGDVSFGIVFETEQQAKIAETFIRGLMTSDDIDGPNYFALEERIEILNKAIVSFKTVHGNNDVETKPDAMDTSANEVNHYNLIDSRVIKKGRAVDPFEPVFELVHFAWIGDEQSNKRKHDCLFIDSLQIELTPYTLFGRITAKGKTDNKHWSNFFYSFSTREEVVGCFQLLQDLSGLCNNETSSYSDSEIRLISNYLSGFQASMNVPPDVEMEKLRLQLAEIHRLSEPTWNMSTIVGKLRRIQWELQQIPVVKMHETRIEGFLKDRNPVTTLINSIRTCILGEPQICRDFAFVDPDHRVSFRMF